MYHIDKFFSKELSVVLYCLDDEYDRYLQKQKKDEDDFQRQIEDLDDYFLSAEPSPGPEGVEPGDISGIPETDDSDNMVKK